MEKQAKLHCWNSFTIHQKYHRKMNSNMKATRQKERVLCVVSLRF
jgi:hypothetical protein